MEMKKIVKVSVEKPFYEIDKTMDPIENLCLSSINVSNELHDIKTIMRNQERKN